jgi:hypothetical protein
MCSSKGGTLRSTLTKEKRNRRGQLVGRGHANVKVVGDGLHEIVNVFTITFLLNLTVSFQNRKNVWCKLPAKSFVPFAQNNY